MRRIAIALLVASAPISACDTGPKTSAKESSQSTEKVPIAVRASPDAPEQAAFLVEPRQFISTDELRDTVRRARRPCAVVKSFDQLEQDGTLLNAYKLDCLEYSYLLRMDEGRLHISRWDGIIGAQ